MIARPPAPRCSGPGGELADRVCRSAAGPLRTGENHLRLVRELLGEGLAVRLRVAGKSMEPYVADGDLITLRSVTPHALRLGNLVFSQGPGLPPILHRVVSRRRQQDRSWVIRTKGDALRTLDAPVRAEHIVGKVVAVRRESPQGECVEVRVDNRRRPLDLLLAFASRFAPTLFLAISRRVFPRFGTRSARVRKPVVT